MKIKMSNFAGELKVKDNKQKIKMGQKWAWSRSRDLLLNFGTPIIPGKTEDTNVKFCRQIGGKGC